MNFLQSMKTPRAVSPLDYLDINYVKTMNNTIPVL